MRLDLIATSTCLLTPKMTTVPLSLMLRPSCGLPGEYLYSTNSSTLLRLLREKTELRSSVLERFEADLRVSTRVPLLAVELSERTLTEIGYFID